MANPGPYSKEAWLSFVAGVQRDPKSEEKTENVEFFLNSVSALRGTALARFREEVMQNPKRFASEFGTSYQDILTSLNTWGAIAEQSLNDKVWDSISRAAFFGLNGNSSYTDEQFQDYVNRAQKVLELAEQALREDVKPESEVEKIDHPQNKEVFKGSSKGSSETAQEAPSSPNEAVVPQVSKNPLQESVEQLKTFSAGDKKIRQEIVRSQQMVLRQLAIAYGVSEKDQNAFVQELAADLTPIITHELFSMGESDLAEALKGTGVRYAMYRKVLMRAQQSPRFQVSLGKALQSFSPEAKGLSSQQIEKVAVAEQVREEVADAVEGARETGVVSSEQAQSTLEKSDSALSQGMSGKQKSLQARNKVVTPDAVVGLIQREESGSANKGALSDQDIRDISGTLRVDTRVVENNLRLLLSQGAGLTESQTRGIISRLQAHALLGSNVDAIDPLDFERALNEGLGAEKLVILPRISRAMKNSNLSWGRLASAYVRTAKIDVVARTGNTSAMFSDPTREPSRQLIDQMQREVFSRGFETASLGLYAPESAVVGQLQQLETGQSAQSIATLSGKIAPSAYAGAVVNPSGLLEKAVDASPEPKERLRSALNMKRQAVGNLLSFSRSKQSPLEKLEANGFSKETYQEIHWNEKVEYIRTTITQRFVEELSVEFVIPEQEFLMEIVSESPDEYVFYAQDGQPSEYSPEYLDVVLEEGGRLRSAEQLQEVVSGPAPATGGGGKKSRKRVRNKKAMLQAKASAAKEKLQRRALLLALAAIPGGQALLPLVKAGFVAADALRKLPGGEKVYRAVQNLINPDRLKENLKRAFLGVAGLGAASLAATIAYLSQLGGALLGIVKGLGVLGATGAGFLIGNLILPGVGGLIGAGVGFVGSSLALYGSQIASGLQALTGGAAAGFNSALSSTALAVNSATAAATGGVSAVAQSAISGIQGFFGSVFGAGSAVGFLAAPVVGAAVGVAVTGVALNQDVLRQAFLTERKPISISTFGFGGGATGLNQPGCWPTSGELLAIERYCNDGTKHGTLPGSSAVDISADVGVAVYAPFGGTAFFYPEGGYKGTSYGNTTVLKADNGATFIFAHLQNHGNFKQYIWGSAVVLPGDLIGRVNDSGTGSKGSHLHYEVIGGNIRNYLPDPTIESCKRIPVVSACQP